MEPVFKANTMDRGSRFRCWLSPTMMRIAGLLFEFVSRYPKPNETSAMIVSTYIVPARINWPPRCCAQLNNGASSSCI